MATILVIRTQLWLTNYPQLGGHGLHIAHLLYAGIFMVLAIGLLVTFLGRAPRFPGVVVGGIGFGFFIDERRGDRPAAAQRGPLRRSAGEAVGAGGEAGGGPACSAG